MTGARRQRREVSGSLPEAAQEDHIAIKAKGGLDGADLTIGGNDLAGETHEGEENRHLGHLLARGERGAHKGGEEGSGFGGGHVQTVIRSTAAVKRHRKSFQTSPPVYPPGVFDLEVIDEDALEATVEAEGELDVTVEAEEP